MRVGRRVKVAMRNNCMVDVVMRYDARSEKLALYKKPAINCKKERETLGAPKAAFTCLYDGGTLRVYAIS